MLTEFIPLTEAVIRAEQLLLSISTLDAIILITGIEGVFGTPTGATGVHDKLTVCTAELPLVVARIVIDVN